MYVCNVCMYLCMYACVYVCMYVSMYVCMYVCLDGWMDACMHGWMVSYIYIHAYNIYIYLYIFTWCLKNMSFSNHGITPVLGQFFIRFSSSKFFGVPAGLQDWMSQHGSNPLTGAPLVLCLKNSGKTHPLFPERKFAIIFPDKMVILV